MLMRIGLLNYVAGALVMPYTRVPRCGGIAAPRHGSDRGSLRRFVEQACHRLSHLQRIGVRGVPFFFLRVDPAGNVSKRFSAAGFPFARFGGSCPRWVVHTAFSQPGTVQVQIAELPDGAAYLCFARAVASRSRDGASRDRCMWWRWAAPWRTPARLSTPTGWIWSVRGWASGCRAGCATGPIAAAARFRRWSTGCRWIR